MKVVSDSGPIIGFAGAGRLDILHEVLGDIIIPREVRNEILAGGNRPGSSEIQQLPWIQVVDVKNIGEVAKLKRSLGPGESDAIVLAGELNLPLLLDENKARDEAAKYGLTTIIGTCSVLLDAKKQGVISSVKEIIQDLERVNYRIGAHIKAEILNRAGEL
jgi:uncharacterized protein